MGMLRWYLLGTLHKEWGIYAHVRIVGVVATVAENPAPCLAPGAAVAKRGRALTLRVAATAKPCDMVIAFLR